MSQEDSNQDVLPPWLFRVLFMTEKSGSNNSRIQTANIPKELNIRTDIKIKKLEEGNFPLVFHFPNIDPIILVS